MNIFAVDSGISVINEMRPPILLEYVGWIIKADKNQFNADHNLCENIIERQF
jgi:hypothetical protein